MVTVVLARQPTPVDRTCRYAPSTRASSARSPTPGPDEPAHRHHEQQNAEQKLAPYLDAKNPFRDLALYHQAEIADGKGDHPGASRVRHELID